MRVAVIGANLLGCSSAFYVRQALRANRADAAAAASGGAKGGTADAGRGGSSANGGKGVENEDDHDEDDEIVIFDELPRAGGRKFVTLEVDGQSAAVGTAAMFDASSSAPLQALLSAAGIAGPARERTPDWAVLDWRADEYMASRTRNRFLLRLSSSRVACALLQCLALLLSVYFYMRVGAYGWGGAFVMTSRRVGRHLDYLRASLLLLAAWLGFGVVPTGYVLRLHAAIWRHCLVRVLCIINFGAPGLTVLAGLADQMRDKLEQIVQHDAASSCITLGHFLSSCGLARSAATSAAELFAARGVPQRLVDAAVAPALAAMHADSTVTPDSRANAAAAQLALLAASPLPPRLRGHTARFDAAQTKSLCPALARAAGATFRLGTKVGGVFVVKEPAAAGEEEEEGEKEGKKGGQAVYKLCDADGKALGEFDAVVLAAVVNPNGFATDATDEPLRDAVAIHTRGRRSDRRRQRRMLQRRLDETLDGSAGSASATRQGKEEAEEDKDEGEDGSESEEERGERGEDGERGYNTAAVTSLVQGKLRKEFFRVGNVEAVATDTAVRGCGHVSFVSKVERDRNNGGGGEGGEVWRVSGAQALQVGSAGAQAVFSRVGQVKCEQSYHTNPQKAQSRWKGYRVGALRDVHGRLAPSFVLATRFVYAAMVDRVANDVSLDVLSGRNAGSFFRDGVVTWK